MSYDRNSNSDKPDQASSDLERNMRRTLGLGTSATTPRRRFAQDGDVPVVVMRARRDDNREATEAAEKSQREARGQAERTLAAAQASIRDLQTKLAHLEMSQTELRQAFDRVSAQKQALEAALATETNLRVSAEAQLEQEKTARHLLERQLRAQPRPNSTSPRQTSTPEPIDWWSKHERK